jgi:hypothetical protein
MQKRIIIGRFDEHRGGTVAMHIRTVRHILAKKSQGLDSNGVYLLKCYLEALVLLKNATK